MYPEQNQYSIDYLNQISSPQPKRTGSPKFRMIALILGVFAFITIVLMGISQLNKGPVTDMQTLSARLTSLETIVKEAQPHIQSGALRGVNSNLSIFLLNTNRDSVKPLANNQIDPKKIPKSIVNAEAYTEMTETLEDARLNATYDSVYVREMTLRLAELTSLMARIYENSNSKSMQEFLVQSNESLQSIRKQFTEISESSTLQ